MTSTLQPMLAEPSVVGLSLLFLVILAIGAAGIAILGLLFWFLQKLSSGSSATAVPNQRNIAQNRRSGIKSLWLWLPLGFVLALAVIYSVDGFGPKPDVLAPVEFLKMVDSHRIVQAKLYGDSHSSVYTITGTYKKLDEEHVAPAHFKAKMLLTDKMLEGLLANPNVEMVERNRTLLALLMTVLPILLLSLIPLGLGVAVFISIRAASKKNRLPQAPPPTYPATQPISRKCPQCGAQLRPDVPEGLCPACLLQRGIATEGGAPPPSKPFTPPPISELARLFPQLEILEVIGEGGMGAVYKARQPALERFVALKILTPRSGGDLDFAGRFTREARALAKLSHPNIVGVYDFGTVPRALGLSGERSETGETPVLHYFIMEYVDGPNLRQVEQAGKLTPREALQIIPQICAALQFAHDEGIVHRDIKPENVLIDKKGRVKIADFGLAKILGQQADLRLTGARDIMGTPHYMAPEQVEKPQEVDHRADIYSLGVVFYEMLTGELPLGKFDPPSQKVQVDVRLDEVVLRSLAKSPERRYQQVSEIKTEIENISQRPSVKPARGGFRPWMWIPIGATGMLVLIIAVNGSKRPPIDVPASANFHYQVFECDASNVDRLIPSRERQRVAETNAFVATVGTNTLDDLLAAVVPQRYILKDDERLVTSSSWKPGMATTWSYTFNEPPPVIGVCQGTAAGFLGVRNQKGELEARVDVLLHHSFFPSTFAPDTGVDSRLFYEGPSPDGALVFLMPYAGPNNSPRYLIAAFRITDTTAQYASEPVPKAIVHIRRFNVITSVDNFSSDYAATVPLGYELRATADFGRVSVMAMPGTQEYRLQWMWERTWHPPKMLAPGQSIPPNYHPLPPLTFDSSAQRQAQAATVKAQLGELQDQGPIPIFLGQPKQLFCVTNGSGEIFRGFLELVQVQTNQPSDALAKLIAQRQPELDQGTNALTRLMAQQRESTVRPDSGLPESGASVSARQNILADQPPVVVETFPVSGARNVAPGLAEIRVRFSREMADGSWSWSTAWEDSTPDVVESPHYLDDDRTCVMKVRLEPGKTYAWWLNSEQFKNFKDREGRPAVPYLLTFQTQSKEQLK